jgi:uncharacterized spore protein YtfJ
MTDEEQSKFDPQGIFDHSELQESYADSMETFLEAAGVDAVYGVPVEHNDNMIIPAAEVLGVLGIGFGGGGGYGAPTADKKEADYGGGKGGGGGGRVFSRPVAVIISSPQGVRVEPVVDITKLGLAALTALGFMVGTVFSMRSHRRVARDFRKQLKEARGG